MPRSRLRLEFAEQYLRNLARLEDFLDDEARFEELVSALDARCSRLSKLPGLGRPLVPREADTAEFRAALEVMIASTRDEVRELLVGDYLVLYAVSSRRITMIAVRHQRNAGYDLSGD